MITLQLLDENIKSMGGHLLGIVLSILVLMVWVFYVQRNQLKILEKHHGVVETMSSDDSFYNPYATRNPTITQGGLGTNMAQVWGNSPSRNRSSNFLGSPEPPVFYDIGDVSAVRKTRNKAAAAGDDVTMPMRRVVYENTGEVDSDGKAIKKLVFKDCDPGQIVYNNNCVTPESATFVPIHEGFDDDAQLLDMAQGGINSY
jgi:hypothetical protein